MPEMIISGCIGLRGDGYRVDSRMTKSWTREIQWHSAGHYRELQRRLPNLTVVGGCCGTNHRHVAEIRAAVTR